MNYIIMSEENATYYDLKSYCKTNFSNKTFDDLKIFVSQYCNIDVDKLRDSSLKNKTGVIIKKSELINELSSIKTRVDNGDLVI